MGTDHDLIRTKMMEQRCAERFMRRTQALEKQEQEIYQKDGPLGTTPPARKAPQILDRRVCIFSLSLRYFLWDLVSVGLMSCHFSYLGGLIQLLPWNDVM